MTLLELCEPLFRRICALNRAARVGRTHEATSLRADIEEIFAHMKADASTVPALVAQYGEVVRPLTFFVDFMIISKDTELNLGEPWDPLGIRWWQELAGDERFFEMLRKTLDDTSAEATERLTVYYTCIGLGFSGVHIGQPEILRKLMLEIYARIRHLVDADQSTRLTPEAYQNVDTRDLIEPPGKKLMSITIALLVMIVVLFVFKSYLFKSKSADLTGHFDAIVEKRDKEITP